MIRIRVEDFSYGEGYLDFAGRTVLGNSILSAHIQRRTSGELVGLLGAIAAGLWTLTLTFPAGAKAAILLFMAFLAAGAIREIQRNYVVALNIYQLGHMEVFGLNKADAMEMQTILDAARAGVRSAPVWASSLSADG